MLWKEVVDFNALHSIKSILIHEYQHKSTRVNTNQHESNTSQHESNTVNTNLTRANTSPTRVNTNQHESNTIQNESDTSQHELTRVQNRSYIRFFSKFKSN